MNGDRADVMFNKKMRLAQLMGVQKSLHKQLKYFADDPSEKADILKQLKNINKELLKKEESKKDGGSPTSAIAIDSNDATTEAVGLVYDSDNDSGDDDIYS